VVALVRNLTGSEEIDAYRGLVWRSPLLAVTMALFLFSLLGFPPLAGFAGKFQVFESVYEAAKAATASGKSNLGFAFYGLLGVGALNTAASAYYYLRVVRTMILDEEEHASPPVATGGVSPGASVYLTVLAALLIAVGVIWNPLTAACERAANTFKVSRPASSAIPPQR